jgi:predicted nucleotidyltransferase
MDNGNQQITTMDKEQAFELVRKYLILLNDHRISFEGAWVFGSFAKGNFHKDSDIDLALVIHECADRISLQTELLKLGRDFNYIIEPHPFSPGEFNHFHPLAHEILTYGIKVG